MTKRRVETKPSTDELVKRCAREFGLSRKLLKRAVQQATFQAVVDRIVQGELESSWNGALESETKPDETHKE